MIALHRNATHLAQPLDVSFFRTLKQTWQKNIAETCKSASLVGLKKYQFAPIFKKALEDVKNSKMLQNGFRTCGLYPFDVKALDFTKLFNSLKSSKKQTVETNNIPDIISNSSPLKILEELISQEKLQEFRLNTDGAWNGLLEDKRLFEIRYSQAYPNISAHGNENVKNNTSISENIENSSQVVTIYTFHFLHFTIF